MIHLKSIHSSLTPAQQASFIRTSCFRRKKTFVSFSKYSRNSSSDGKGDIRQQELLATIALLQTQKLRLTEYLDERSAYLTQFAEEANTEMDQIGENALKELDEAGARIMGNIENQMQAFEESMGLNKQEIEENEKKLAEFEGQIEEERNEWLFFKNLRQRRTVAVDKAEAKEEMEKIKQLSRENAGSTTRRIVYLALIGLVVVGIADVFISSSSDWRKGAVLGVILVCLLSQVMIKWLSIRTIVVPQIVGFVELSLQLNDHTEFLYRRRVFLLSKVMSIPEEYISRRGRFAISSSFCATSAPTGHVLALHLRPSRTYAASAPAGHPTVAVTSLRLICGCRGRFAISSSFCATSVPTSRVPVLYLRPQVTLQRETVCTFYLEGSHPFVMHLHGIRIALALGETKAELNNDDSARHDLVLASLSMWS
ncbi:putative AT-rich interactive domain-containing protein 2-like isoform X1 [Capsicum annuum]|nr:putative AT-rich interactive domain-containing protein 2-like isoform X1 [Capsicum annuum]KAF3672408.1 putative AT-rich interactive domain-containing protein 2-like isoform X1 [Capsicum annuum]